MGSAASRGPTAGAADQEAQRSAPPPQQPQPHHQKHELVSQLLQQRQEEQPQQPAPAAAAAAARTNPQHTPSPLNLFFGRLFQTRAADGSKIGEHGAQAPHQQPSPSGALQSWGGEDGAVSTAVTRAVAFGLTGAGFGGVLAAIKDASALFFMTSMGANYLMIGLVYFGTLEVAKHELPQLKDWERHAAVGATTGAFLGSLASPKRRLSFAAIFAAGGVGGYFLHRGLLSLREARRATVLEDYRREEQARLERDGK
jgi:hypothetical protein